jgi:hypothetical protein
LHFIFGFSIVNRVKQLHTFFKLTGIFSVLVFSGIVIFSLGTPAHAACSKPAPLTAAAYQSLLRDPINGKWYHGDSGASVKIPDGRVLWTFGDTVIGSAAATRGSTFINNSALIVEKGCITPLTGPINAQGKETTWIKPTTLTDIAGKDDYYWSTTPFMDGSTLRMFVQHMYNDASGFHPIGTDLVTFSLSGSVPKVASISKTPGSVGYEKLPLWGAAVVRSGNYTYVFGSINKHETWVFGSYYYLARVPNGSLTNQSSWRYWTGSTWSTVQSAAQPIITGAAGLGTVVSIQKKSTGEYILISKKYDAFGTDLFAWKATNLTGPWTEVTPALIAPIPTTKATEQDITYLGLGHPEALLLSGKLLVTWSFNSNDPSFFGDSRYGIYFSEVNQP